MARPVLLTVDDDRSVLAAVQQDLRSKYGEEYRIVSAQSGAAALEALRELRLRDTPVALMLVDQRMPQMTGVEFLEQAVELYPDAKRVLLTAYADSEAAIRAINEASIHYYLLKPWDPPEDRLYPVIDDLLETWRPPPPLADVRVLGHRWSRSSHEVREFLGRNLVPYRWLDVEREDEAKELLEIAGLADGPFPVVLLADGSTLVQPTPAEVAERIGLRTRAESPFYDLVVVGGGPGGLAAGVYGATEGLMTLMVERTAPGGQAGTSARIENYLGFPAGLSGADLTMRAIQQARRFGVEILTPQEVVRLERKDPYRILTLADGSQVSAQSVVVATGVSYRTLAVPGAERLAGAGVYYSAGRPEAIDHTDQDVYLVGGGNSAGQAAMFLSLFSSSVTILVRGDSLAEFMSRYLIDRIEEAENVHVIANSEVVEVRGDSHVEGLVLLHRQSGEKEEVPAGALFVFIGQAPRTDWLDGVVERDPGGFVRTGGDLGASPPGWTLERAPLPLETSVPGVFAVGDVRAASVKRVASAVGEGAMAVRFIHEHLVSG
jgi:thioredoxin reductase (NADPH)